MTHTVTQPYSHRSKMANIKMLRIIFSTTFAMCCFPGLCRSKIQSEQVKDFQIIHNSSRSCVLGWCLPKDYQKLESPRPDSPVHVDINVEILDILSVNDKEFSITMSMYFSVMWQESRIVTQNKIEPGFWYPVSLEFLQDLWIPNVFIYNLKSFQNIAVLKRLAGRPDTSL